jgi:hypothetical protein
VVPGGAASKGVAPTRPRTSRRALGPGRACPPPFAAASPLPEPDDGTLLEAEVSRGAGDAGLLAPGSPVRVGARMAHLFPDGDGG